MLKVVSVAILTLALCGCARNARSIGAMITVYVKSYDQALNLNDALVSLAIENGFDKKTYDGSGTFSSFKEILLSTTYQAPNLPGRSFVSLSYSTDIKKSGGCFMVLISLDNGNEFEIELLAKQFEQTMRKHLPNSTVIYRNSYCGKDNRIRATPTLHAHQPAHLQPPLEAAEHWTE